MILSYVNPFGHFVLALICRSLALFAVTALMLLILRSASAACRAFVWTLCLCGMILLPLLAVTAPRLVLHIPYAHNPALVTPAASIPDAPVSSAGSAPVPASTVVASPAPAAPYSAPQAAVPSPVRPARPDLTLLFCSIWALGLLTFALRYAAGFLRLRSLHRAATPASASVYAAGREICSRSGIRRTVRYIQSAEDGVSPMTWGWLRPVVLLPEYAGGWEAEKIEPVLLHELAHVARKDWPVLMLADLAAALYWFHPLIWMLRRQLRTECERACDDNVLGYGHIPADYASLLVSIARERSQVRHGSLALAIAMRSTSCRVMERRVRSVLSTGERRNPVPRFLAVAGMLMLALLLAPLASAQFVLGSAGSSSFAVSQWTAGTPVDQLSGELEPPGSEPLGAREGSASPGLTTALRSAEPTAPPADAKPAPALTGFSWGPKMDGMQLGIKISGPTHAFEARQRVNWDCYLRNTTDHDLGLAFGGHWYMEELPEVYRDAPGAAGTKLQVQGAFFTGLDPEFCLVLKPGEAVSVYAIGLGLGKDQGLAGGENKPHEGNLPYLIEPAIGAYLLKQTVLAHTMPTSEVARINGPTNDRIFNDRNDLTVLGADGKTTTKIAARMIPLDIQCKPLTSGAERFTIAAHAQPKAAAGSASDSANPTVGADNVSWGKAVSGLQAGLRSPDGRTAWGYGDTVEMDYIVRNISRHPIEFEHDVTPGVAGVISNILDAQGRPASTFGLPVIHTAAMVHVVLDPGSSIVVGQTRMGVLPRGGSSRQLASPTSNWVEAGPGDYTIRHLDTLNIMGAGAGNLTLYTGYLKLHIQPAALEGSGPSLKTTDVQPQAAAAAGEPAVSSAAAGRETISWGKSIDGLRAGLALHENSIRIGKDLRADLYINNTSNHEIKIDYISNDDKFIVPDLWNSKRQKLKYDWRDMTVEQKIAGHAVLKPGESACVAHPGLNVSPWGNNEEAQLNVGTMFTHFVAQPGVFHVRFTAALMGPNTTWMYYPTAEVKFTLTGFGG